MKLEEMKLAVCEKLPELIVWRQGENMSMPYHREGFFWRGMYDANNLFREINWPTEGLQVCHEAEKLLTNEQIQDYFYILNDVIGLVDSTSPAWIKEWSVFAHANATYQQRLEALCRVWYPERFTK